MLILVFGVYLRVLPCSGRGGIEHLIMPSVCLGWYLSATYLRLTRSSLLEVLGSDYIKFIRIKGLPEVMVVAKHALKNAIIPIITYAGVQLVLRVNGMVVVEVVFAWPGTGLLLYEGIINRDYPVVQTVILLETLLMVAGTLLVDILYAYIDPRIRLR
jgi:peptide/nickel transport system permease protein